MAYCQVKRLPIAREYIKHLVADGRYDYLDDIAEPGGVGACRPLIYPSRDCMMNALRASASSAT